MPNDPMDSSGYRRREPLSARLSIYDFQQDRVDLPGEATFLLSEVSGIVLDVGCGLGQYVDRLVSERPDLQLFGVDQSPVMARHVLADATHLPFADSTCGAALAMHMLYHVDIPTAVAELRRVVSPGGVVLASTNGSRDKQELYDVIGAAAGTPFVDLARAFTFSGIDLLANAFDEVELHTWTRKTVVPTLQPLAAFVASMELAPKLEERTVALLKDTLARDGTFTMTSESGIFSCR